MSFWAFWLLKRAIYLFSTSSWEILNLNPSTYWEQEANWFWIYEPWVLHWSAWFLNYSVWEHWLFNWFNLFYNSPILWARSLFSAVTVYKALFPASYLSTSLFNLSAVMESDWACPLQAVSSFWNKLDCWAHWSNLALNSSSLCWESLFWFLLVYMFWDKRAIWEATDWIPLVCSSATLTLLSSSGILAFSNCNLFLSLVKMAKLFLAFTRSFSWLFNLVSESLRLFSILAKKAILCWHCWEEAINSETLLFNWTLACLRVWVS